MVSEVWSRCLGASANAPPSKSPPSCFPRPARLPAYAVIPITPPTLFLVVAIFLIELVIASTAEPRELLEVCTKLVAKAFESGVFMFTDTDLSMINPKPRSFSITTRWRRSDLTSKRLGPTFRRC